MDLVFELLERAAAGAADRLVGRNDDALDLCRVVDGLEGGEVTVSSAAALVTGVLVTLFTVTEKLAWSSSWATGESV